MHDFDELDGLILRAIFDGNRRFNHISKAAGIKSECVKFESFKSSWDRILYRRLQALRKNGKIAYSTEHGWKLIYG